MRAAKKNEVRRNVPLLSESNAEYGKSALTRLVTFSAASSPAPSTIIGIRGRRTISTESSPTTVISRDETTITANDQIPVLTNICVSLNLLNAVIAVKNNIGIVI